MLRGIKMRSGLNWLMDLMMNSHLDLQKLMRIDLLMQKHYRHLLTDNIAQNIIVQNNLYPHINFIPKNYFKARLLSPQTIPAILKPPRHFQCPTCPAHQTTVSKGRLRQE